MTQWGLDTLFNPAKRHMDEEKRRLQSTREEIGDSSGGKRIDLESGKVKIKRGERAADADADPAEADDEATDDEVTQDEATPTEDVAEAKTEDTETDESRTDGA